MPALLLMPGEACLAPMDNQQGDKQQGLHLKLNPMPRQLALLRDMVPQQALEVAWVFGVGELARAREVVIV